MVTVDYPDEIPYRASDCPLVHALITGRRGNCNQFGRICQYWAVAESTAILFNRKPIGLRPVSHQAEGDDSVVESLRSCVLQIHRSIAGRRPVMPGC